MSEEIDDLASWFSKIRKRIKIRQSIEAGNDCRKEIIEFQLKWNEEYDKIRKNGVENEKDN